MKSVIRTIFSSLLIMCGGFLLFVGAREFVVSRLGQSDAAKEFQESVEQPAPRASEGETLPLHVGDTFAKLIIPLKFIF